MFTTAQGELIFCSRKVHKEKNVLVNFPPPQVSDERGKNISPLKISCYLRAKQALLVRSVHPCLYTCVSYVRPFGPMGGAKCNMASTRNAHM